MTQWSHQKRVIYTKNCTKMQFRLLLLACSFLLSIEWTHGQSITLVPKFDSKLTKYYKVDTCRVYENVSNGQQTVQYLRKLYLFNSEGLISQEVEFGQSEFDGHTIIKYDYNSNHNITRKQILRPEREPIIYDYRYTGNKWTSMTATQPILREFEIQSNDVGLVLGIIVKSMIPERDTLGELTGKEIFGKMEEYEFRYNRFYKVVKENFYYMNEEMNSKVYQYSPNGYGPPLNMSFFKAGEKTPDYVTTYTYDATGFLHMEVTKESGTGYTNTLEYEYAYAWDSPLLEKQPELEKGQKFWIGKKK